MPPGESLCVVVTRAWLGALLVSDELRVAACADRRVRTRDFVMPARPTLERTGTARAHVGRVQLYPGVFPWRGVSAIGRVRVGCLIWQPSGLPKMATGSVAYYGNRRAFGVGAA